MRSRSKIVVRLDAQGALAPDRWRRRTDDPGHGIPELANLEMRPGSPVSTTSAADKIPVQTVVRAFSVLEVLATAPTGLRLADLSRIVGLHKATVYRLVRTMVLLGYVTQTADGAPYRLRSQFIGGDSRATPSPAERDSLQRAGRDAPCEIPISDTLDHRG